MSVFTTNKTVADLTARFLFRQQNLATMSNMCQEFASNSNTNDEHQPTPKNTQYFTHQVLLYFIVVLYYHDDNDVF